LCWSLFFFPAPKAKILFPTPRLQGSAFTVRLDQAALSPSLFPFYKKACVSFPPKTPKTATPAPTAVRPTPFFCPPTPTGKGAGPNSVFPPVPRWGPFPFGVVPRAPPTPPPPPAFQPGTLLKSSPWSNPLPNHNCGGFLSPQNFTPTFLGALAVGGG